MSQSRFSPGLIAGILVALFFGVALYLRVALPYDQVFVGDWIKLTGTDAYHFMRHVDSLVHNFPNLISFDPYMRYPHGYQLGSLNFFVYLLGGITWLIGLGSPTQHTIDIVGVYFPAVLGALTVIPVYFIGKALFNRWAGVIAAGLFAILPGEFLGRSILGFTDRDALQVLLTALTMLFLILAIKSARQKELAFSQKHWNRTTATKPLTYSLLAGIFLGLYLLIWRGAFIFILIIFTYFVVQSIIDHLKHRNVDYLSFVGTITFLVALLIFLLSHPSLVDLVPLVIALLTPPILAIISQLMLRTRAKVGYYPVALFSLGLAGSAILYIVNPSLLNSILNQLKILAPSETELTVLEMQPILFPGGVFSLSVIWGNFTTGFFLSLISLGILIYLVIKRGEADKTLILVWSLMILAATLSLRRMALLLTLNVALLTGYLSWLVLQFAGFKEIAAEPAEIPKGLKKGKERKRQKVSLRRTGSRANMALGIILVFFITFLPNISPAINTASQARFAPSDAWCESLSWLKDNTPDPFGDPNFYYDFYETPFRYPETAYGVVAWWDYGYWIIRIGHRLPNCDPGGGAREVVARFFTAQDEASANEILDQWGSKYVIVDNAIAKVVGGKFQALATFSGNSPDKFYGIYYQLKDNTLEPVLLFYPEYYRSFIVRLYNFDGGRVIARSSIVISSEEKVTPDGQFYRQITDAKSFGSYEDARAYITSQKSGNYKVVSPNPYVSPVTLPALNHYKLIYSSKGSVTDPGIGTVPEVKIFEYTK